MSNGVIIAIIGAVPALITALVSIVLNNRLLGYKLDELTKRVEKHNNFMERVAVLERDNKTAFNEISETKEDLRRIQDKLAK